MKLDTCYYDQDAVDYINYYTYFYAERWIFADVRMSKFADEFSKANNKETLWRVG